MASFISTVSAPPTPRSSAVTGTPALAGADDHVAQTLAHVGQAGGQGQNRHDFAGNGDIIAGFAREFLCGASADGDAAQIAVVGVDNTPPGDAVRIDVQPDECADFFLGQVVGIGFVDAQFFQSLEHDRGKAAVAFFVRRAQAIEQGFI